MLDEIFRQKKPVPEKLLAYGFQSKDGQYEYAACVMENAFLLQIVIDATGTVDTTLTDRESGAEYVLYKTSAPGAYIGAVRMAAAAELQEIADQYFKPSVFSAPQTLRVLDFMSKTYGDAPEFLWEKFADNAVWCRKDTKKMVLGDFRAAEKQAGIRYTAACGDSRLVHHTRADARDDAARTLLPGLAYEQEKLVYDYTRRKRQRCGVVRVYSY